MKKIYSKPTTKFVNVNVSNSVMTESPLVASDPMSNQPLTDEPAPMF